MGDTDTNYLATPAPAPSPEPGWAIVIALHPDPKRVGQRVFPGHGHISFGRALGPFAATAALDHPLVSARHFVIEIEEDRAYVVDSSSNGTIVNNARIAKGERVPLRSGDAITVGPFVLLVRYTVNDGDRPLGAAAAERAVAVEKARRMFVGASHEIREVFQRICEVGEIPILVRGETGTGKEVAASALHVLSGRSKIVRINCGALHHQLSQVFGHVKGAFSGATDNHAGFLEEADGGTLFLDEVAELSAEVQAQLLRFLDTGVLRRLCGKSDVAVDVRVIAATHECLEDRIADKQFREDLYFRLAGAEITLPPVRARIDDVPPLFYHFAGEYRLRHFTVSRTLMSALLGHSWPGNVRELRQVVAQIVEATKARDDEQLRLPVALKNRLESSPSARAASTSTLPLPDTGGSIPPVPNTERPPAEELLRVFHEQNRHAFNTARKFGVSRSTFYRWLDEYGLDILRERKK